MEHFIEHQINIRMISEGSCDPEDWSSGYWKFSFAITWINHMVKYMKIENSLSCNIISKC